MHRPRPHCPSLLSNTRPGRPRARPAASPRSSVPSRRCPRRQGRPANAYNCPRRGRLPRPGRQRGAGPHQQPSPPRPVRRARQRGPPLTEAAGRPGPQRTRRRRRRRHGDGDRGGREGRARSRREAGIRRPPGGRCRGRRPLRAALVSGGGAARAGCGDCAGRVRAAMTCEVEPGPRIKAERHWRRPRGGGASHGLAYGARRGGVFRGAAYGARGRGTPMAGRRIGGERALNTVALPPSRSYGPPAQTPSGSSPRARRAAGAGSDWEVGGAASGEGSACARAGLGPVKR